MDGQTIFAILVGAALACFSLVMVGYSFFRGQSTAHDPTEPAADYANSERRESGPAGRPRDKDGPDLAALLDSIDTLELEHQLGNVPREQYLEQLQAYRVQVAFAIRDLMEQGNAPPELELEREVLEARLVPGAGWQPCPRCDAPLPVFGDGFPTGGLRDGEAGLRGARAKRMCPHCNATLVQDGPASFDASEPAEYPAHVRDQ